MTRIVRILLFLQILPALLILAFSGANAAPNGPEIDVLNVDGAIVPVVADYLDRGITQAEADRAAAVVIVLNTPGGLLSSTEQIVDRILDAKVPVVVYVNKWAGSAGTFITLASHVAAMAPGSRIGAASPISIAPGGGGTTSDTLEKKIKEDTAARIRSLADLHGRNQAAAMATVTDALSFTDKEALGLSPLTEAHRQVLGQTTQYLVPTLVDLGADDLDELIKQLDGRRVTVGGNEVTMVTRDYHIKEMDMSGIERFLRAISDPTIAYILLSIGSIGVILELFNPGAILPGVIGGISLILGFYALAVLEAYWAGILFVVLAFILFVAEALTTTFGVLFVGGIASLVIGALVMFGGRGGLPGLQINWWAVGIVIAFVAAMFLFVIGAVVRAHRRHAATGQEGIVGKMAVARTKLDNTGMVMVEGELWTATAEGDTIEVGQEVVVTRVEGLKLWVRRK